MLLQDTPFLQYLLFLLGRCLTFFTHLCKVTFDIPEAYLEPSQLPNMELFAKIVKGFQATTIFAKSSISDI